MCDYSLAALRTRLAVEGEELIVYRFPTGSLGLTSPAELEAHSGEVRSLRYSFNPHEIPCAVCIPHGACLLVRDMPEYLQRQLGVGAVENVVFIQMSATVGRHRDGLRFKNGQEILLQRLSERQSARVLSLSSAALSEEETDAMVKMSVALA
jgi:hypothetical protein